MLKWLAFFKANKLELYSLSIAVKISSKVIALLFVRAIATLYFLSVNAFVKLTFTIGVSVGDTLILIYSFFQIFLKPEAY